MAALGAGYVYDFATVSHVSFGVGALASVYRIPADLQAAYGDHPVAFMLFVRSVVR
jgi:hypothetical protein